MTKLIDENGIADHIGLTPEQKTARTTGIGGSDAPSLLGLGFKTAYEVWQSKVEGIKKQEEERVPHLWWGSLVEESIRRAYTEDTGNKVVYGHPTQRHESHAWLVANIDGVAFDPEDHSNVHGWEGKNYRSSDGWGKPGTDEIPGGVWVQVQHYMLVIPSLPRFAVSASIFGGPPQHYFVERDQDFIDTLIAIESDFWHQHVLTGVPPEASTLDEAKQKYAEVRCAGLREACDADIQAHKELLELNEEIKRLEKKRDARKLQLQQRIEDSEGLQRDGKPLVTWKRDPDKETLNTKKLIDDNPDLVNMYTVSRPGSRRFLVKK